MAVFRRRASAGAARRLERLQEAVPRVPLLAAVREKSRCRLVDPVYALPLHGNTGRAPLHAACPPQCLDTMRGLLTPIG